MGNVNTKYDDYTVRVEADLPRDCYYDAAEIDSAITIKISYKVYRIPSRKEFVVRFFRNATDDDRSRLQPDKTPRCWRAWERQASIARRRHREGHWFWSVAVGHRVDDPLVQLELEMMIDLDSRLEAAA